MLVLRCTWINSRTDYEEAGQVPRLGMTIMHGDWQRRTAEPGSLVRHVVPAWLCITLPRGPMDMTRPTIVPATVPRWPCGLSAFRGANRLVLVGLSEGEPPLLTADRVDTVGRCY